MDASVPVIIEALIKGIHNEYARRKAALWLGNLQQDSPNAIEALTNALGDESENVRLEASYSLQRIQKSEKLQKICEWKILEQDRKSDFYKSGCGLLHIFKRGLVEEFKFCPYCADDLIILSPNNNL